MTETGFHLPASLSEALRLLRDDPEAAPLAGGMSMVAMMNAQLVAPSCIVSLRQVSELRGISLGSGGTIRIGAMTTHAQTSQDIRLSGMRACVRQAAAGIASAPVRNVGTMGGSICLADPAADYPAALVACGATIEVANAEGTRMIDAQEFFVDWYTTALEPGELVVAIHLPDEGEGAGAYIKFARTAGDFAMVSIAITVNMNGACRVAVGACGPCPIVSLEANELLGGRRHDDAIVRRAGALLAEASDPTDDVRASADYRKRLIPRLLQRAVAVVHAQVSQVSTVMS